MQIIKLDAINSTNTFLKQMYDNRMLKHNTVALSFSQTNGRGQRGGVWQSEPYKNIALSLYREFNFIPIHEQFNISKAVSVGLVNAFKLLGLPNVLIKWPNDILSCKYKISGILIETILKATVLKGAIIGVGVNVNQDVFKNLPRAASLKSVTGKIFDLDYTAEIILNSIIAELNNLEKLDYNKLHQAYLSSLFQLEEVSTFKTTAGIRPGIIKGVDRAGRLQVLFEDDTFQTFGLKEIGLLY